MKRQKGYTLLEAVIVVAIVGLLATIAIRSYADYLIRIQVAEGISLTDGTRTAIMTYFYDMGELPNNNNKAGLPNNNDINSKYTKMVVINKHMVQIQYGGDANKVIWGKKLIFKPVITASGAFQWTCYSKNIPSKYLPPNCR